MYARRLLDREIYPTNDNADEVKCTFKCRRPHSETNPLYEFSSPLQAEFAAHLDCYREWRDYTNSKPSITKAK